VDVRVTCSRRRAGVTAELALEGLELGLRGAASPPIGCGFINSGINNDDCIV
jgi:hypothetical protein